MLPGPSILTRYGITSTSYVKKQRVYALRDHALDSEQVDCPDESALLAIHGTC